MGVAQFFLRYRGAGPYNQSAGSGDFADLLGGDAVVPGSSTSAFAPSRLAGHHVPGLILGEKRDMGGVAVERDLSAEIT